MAGRLRVLIVDDHPLFRQGLKQVVQEDPQFEVVGEAGDGKVAWEQIREKKPDIAVLDVSLPSLSGLDVAAKVRDENLATRVVILTMYKEEETFNRALDLGVHGFVLKENAVQDILNSLTSVARGEHYLSPSISGASASPTAIL